MSIRARHLSFRPARLVASLGLALSMTVAPLGCGDDDDENGIPLDDGALVVMTRNVYLGAPLEPLLDLADPTQLPAAVGTTWRTVQESDVPGRMARIAGEIAAARPDVIALQEVARFETRPVAGAAPGTPVYDFLELLLAELRARGLAYVAAGVATNFDGELPDDTGLRIRLVDRDVVLVRSGVVFSDVQTGQYAARVGISAGLVSVAIPRGWVSMAMEAEGIAMRFVNTHLEVGAFPDVQETQARELLTILPESGFVVVAGDLNSAADGSTTETYALVRGAGFDDPWLQLRPAEPGPTCCFAADLRDVAVPLTERIDLVLHRGSLTPSAVELVGEDLADLTPAGLRPSDHAGVVSTFLGR